MTLKLNGTNSVAAPAYAGADADTGLQCGTDELNLVTGGTARATVDSSGNVGIGDTSPTSLGSNITTIHAKGSSGAGIAFGSTSSDQSLALYTSGDGTIARLRTIANMPLAIGTNGTERMRLDTSGRLLVGVTTAFDTDSNALIQAVNSSGGEIVVGRDFALGSGSTIGRIGFFTKPSSVAEGARIEAVADALHSGGAPTRLTFHTTAASASSPTERVRITSGGLLHASTLTTDTSRFGSSSSHFFHIATANVYAVTIENSSNSSPYGLQIDFDDDNPDNNTNAFINCKDSTTSRFIVWSDGDVDNHDNSYSGISDVKLKQDIVDAGSQWDDIKNLRVRKFKFKSDVADYGDEAKTLIGVVAQETELVSPGLVKESPDVDEDGNDLGTTTKSVRYSVLYMKAVKALQEAQTRIETLESQHADLLARVTALEAAS